MIGSSDGQGAGAFLGGREMGEAASRLADEPVITLRKDVYKAIIPSRPVAWTASLMAALLVMAIGSQWLIVHLGIGAPHLPQLIADPATAIPALGIHALHRGAQLALLAVLAIFAFHYFDVHRRWGIFKAGEPESHYWTSMRNWKHPFLWGVGLTVLYFMLTLDGESVRFGGHPQLLTQLPDAFIFLHSPSIWTDLAYALIGFYIVDLVDYLAHRFNHFHPVLYNRFPFAHFVHHNVVYVNPMSLAVSPFVHFASITGFTMYVILLSQGLLLPMFLIHVLKVAANMLSHLGCDPFPWLSRLNFRVGGWIPWIPLHHQYHHVPSIKGNFGNLTSLWDHVFGTLAPEYVTHVTTGKPDPRIERMMSNHNGSIDRLMAGKTRFNLR